MLVQARQTALPPDTIVISDGRSFTRWGAARGIFTSPERSVLLTEVRLSTGTFHVLQFVPSCSRRTGNTSLAFGVPCLGVCSRCQGGPDALDCGAFNSRLVRRFEFLAISKLACRMHSVLLAWTFPCDEIFLHRIVKSLSHLFSTLGSLSTFLLDSSWYRCRHQHLKCSFQFSSHLTCAVF
jgi:hypothetical protein